MGAAVVLGARREDRLKEVVNRIVAAGGTTTGVVVDVTKRDDLVRLVHTAVERHGQLDVLVSNAGTMAVSRQRDEIATPPSAVASAIEFAIAQPPGIDISEVVVRPTVQA